MNGSDRVRKRSYTLLYRIYRRIRYILYLRHQRKLSKRQLKKQNKEEEQQLRQDLREHIRQLRSDEKVKKQFEKEQRKKEYAKVKQRLRQQMTLSEDIKRSESKLEREKRKRETAVRRRERQRMLRYTARLQLRYFFMRLRSFRVSDIVGYFNDNRRNMERFLLIAMNSTILFLLSYLALFILNLAVTALAAKLFHYPTILYYYEVYFNISVEDWYHDSVKTIFSSGPIIALLAGISFMILFNSRKESGGVSKLFFLWGFLHGISMFFGAILVGTLFDKGIGHVITWMYIMDTGKVLYSIISIFMLVLAGLIIVKPFLISGNSYFQNMTKLNRRGFIWAQVIIPFLLGIAILIALRWPRFMFYETFISLTIFISLLPVITSYSAYSDLYFEEDIQPASFSWRNFFILLAVMLFYRVALSFGISFPG